jgi:dTDP-4-amino-4,6-dideoxygalactose transaminase
MTASSQGSIQVPSWPVHDDAEERNLLAVLRSGAWFAGMTGSDHGTQTVHLEAEFARSQQASHAVAVANGTAALEIALRAVGIGPGDEVIVPAYTFIATASAVAQVGATPVIVDVLEGDLGLDPDQAARAIGALTKAILPVHVGGQVAEMDRVRRLADDHGLFVVEDCAHAHGSVRFSVPAGGFGSMGCFSFQHAKTMSGGEGGMIVTEDEQLALRLRSLRSCGRTDPTDPYLHGLLGWNYRITEWQSAVLRAQLERAAEQRARRERSAARLRELFRDSVDGIVALDPAPGTGNHNFYYFTLVLCEDLLRRVGKDALLHAVRARGVPASGGYPRPIGDNPVFEHVPVRRLPTPVTQDLCRRLIHLPHYLLLADDATLVAVRDVFRHAALRREQGHTA